MTSIAGLTPTVCALMGLDATVQGMAPAFDAPLAHARNQEINTVAKALLFAPDAVGLHLHQRFPHAFDGVAAMAPVAVDLVAALPSVTPVCFATMFTGLPPSVHGVQTYAKPVVKAPTLFDHALRAGLSVAIVAVQASSVDLLFRERELDYFSEPSDPADTERALALIEGGEHDLIVAYQQDYDDAVHGTGPFSTEAVEALDAHLAAFETLGTAANQSWARHARLLAFIPDHGAHAEGDGTGSHGLDLPEDLNVRHYFAVAPGTP